MKRIPAKTLLLIYSLMILLISCQKEINFQNSNNSGGNTGGGGTSNNSIIGEWNFVGMVAHTSSSVSVVAGSDQLKSITVSDYATKNNVGTVKITSTQFISTGLAYSIDTTMNVKTYINGSLFDDSDLPFVLSAPANSSTSDYTRINNDSLTMIGAFGAPSGPSGTTPTGPVGVRISWAGDTLLLKVASSFTQTISQGGVPGVLTGVVNGITKLKRL